jgi:GntR family transcriptional repressor for pyruvate dehydrogenase complex
MTDNDTQAGEAPIMPRRAPGGLTAWRPVHQQRGLVQEIGRRIAADIAGGRLAPGARLPTEQEMMVALGVSRTVVREAVAALRAEGMVTTRQGVGAFVAAAPPQPPFRIEPGQLDSLTHAIDIMELRAAVETEAAGLAAERATRAQLRAMRSALRAIDAAIARNEPAVREDFALHAAIAEATGNPQFRRFLDFLGHHVIPRVSVRVAAPDLPLYLRMIQQEHGAILEAIESRSVARAQRAMRAHLLNSRERYRKLAQALV